MDAPSGPIRDLTKAIEEAGGIVVEFDFGTQQADAISEWIEDKKDSRPIFLINSNSNIPWDRRADLSSRIGAYHFAQVSE